MVLRYVGSKEKISRKEPGGNYEQRSPCVVIIDTSDSMILDDQIGQVNAGLAELIAKLQKNDITGRRVELCLVRFGGEVSILMPFSPVEESETPTLVASGDTPMAEAVLLAYEAIEKRYSELATEGIEFHPAMAILLTDGEPNRDSPIEKAYQLVCEKERQRNRSRRVAFMAFGTGMANMGKLQKLSKRPVHKLKPGCFDKLFDWIAQSLEQASISQVGEGFDIDDPEAAGFAKKLRLFSPKDEEEEEEEEKE